MGHWHCFECKRRQCSKLKKRRVGEPCLWEKYKNHTNRPYFNLNKDSIICDKCYLKIIGNHGYYGKKNSRTMRSNKENVRGNEMKLITHDFKSNQNLKESSQTINNRSYLAPTDDNSTGNKNTSIDASVSILVPYSQSQSQEEQGSESMEINDTIQTSPSVVATSSESDISQISTNSSDHLDSQLEEYPLEERLSLRMSSSDSSHLENGVRENNDSQLTSSDSENVNISFDEESLADSSKSSSSVLSLNSKNKIKIQGVSSTKSTERSCFICNSIKKRFRIPVRAKLQLWILKKIRVAPNNRCCPHHIENGLFSRETIKIIKANFSYSYMTPIEIKEWMKSLGQEMGRKKKYLDFEDSSCLVSETEHLALLGLTREHFLDLSNYLSSLRNSSNRSILNALAMLLIRLRLNIKLKVIAILFGIPSVSAVSKTLKKVTDVLKQNFTPKYLGFNHLSREQLIEEKSVKSFNTLFEKDSDTLIVIMDGTYVYIQKPSNFELQRKTYSQHKYRNLVKVMMTVSTNGYIIDADGIYYADSYNNDANIMKSMISNSSLLDLMQAGDVIIVDRGFRDAMESIEDYAIYAYAPSFLNNKQKKFNAAEGNSSRRVTMLRWIVEAVNGRIKNVFNIFETSLPALYLNSKIKDWFQLCCAISNCYFEPIFKDSETQQRRVDLALKRMETTNSLKIKLEEEGLINKRVVWVEIEPDAIPEFPKLSERVLEEITLGTYQIKLAPNYASEHLMSLSKFKIFIHQEEKDLLRSKIQARFCKRNSYFVWVKFVPHENSYDGIVSWFCSCKQGERTLGCCAHVTSLIWYLAFARYNSHSISKKSDLSKSIIDCAQTLGDDSSSDENSDSDSE